MDFDAKIYLEAMLNDKRKHIQIIGLFGLLKKYSFENKDQMNFFINRNLKIAKELKPFPLDRIKDTLEYLLQTADYKVTLETVSKYIMEDINKLKKEEPILIYEGKEIYDIDIVKEMEQKGKIKWNGYKWVKKL